MRQQVDIYLKVTLDVESTKSVKEIEEFILENNKVNETEDYQFHSLQVTKIQEEAEIYGNK